MTRIQLIKKIVDRWIHHGNNRWLQPLCEQTLLLNYIGDTRIWPIKHHVTVWHHLHPPLLWWHSGQWLWPLYGQSPHPPQWHTPSAQPGPTSRWTNSSVSQVILWTISRYKVWCAVAGLLPERCWLGMQGESWYPASPVWHRSGHCTLQRKPSSHVSGSQGYKGTTTFPVIWCNRLIL